MKFPAILAYFGTQVLNKVILQIWGLGIRNLHFITERSISIGFPWATPAPQSTVEP